MNKVFVYGSLLKGMGNSRLLKDAKLLGRTKITGFTMLDLGWFPGIVVNNDTKTPVYGEVYEVDDETFTRLDHLEGYNPSNPESGLYNKTIVSTDFGDATVYVYNNRRYIGIDHIVYTGDWRSHYKSKFDE